MKPGPVMQRRDPFQVLAGLPRFPGLCDDDELDTCEGLPELVSGHLLQRGKIRRTGERQQQRDLRLGIRGIQPMDLWGIRIRPELLGDGDRQDRTALSDEDHMAPLRPQPSRFGFDLLQQLRLRQQPVQHVDPAQPILPLIRMLPGKRDGLVPLARRHQRLQLRANRAFPLAPDHEEPTRFLGELLPDLPPFGKRRCLRCARASIGVWRQGGDLVVSRGWHERHDGERTHDQLLANRKRQPLSRYQLFKSGFVVAMVGKAVAVEDAQEGDAVGGEPLRQPTHEAVNHLAANTGMNVGVARRQATVDRRRIQHDDLERRGLFSRRQRIPDVAHITHETSGQLRHPMLKVPPRVVECGLLDIDADGPPCASQQCVTRMRPRAHSHIQDVRTHKQRRISSMGHVQRLSQVLCSRIVVRVFRLVHAFEDLPRQVPAARQPGEIDAG